MDEQTTLISVSGPKDKEPPSRNKQMKSSAGVTATTGVELVHHPTTGRLVGDEYTIEERQRQYLDCTS
jgi:hypothetical protein